MHLFQIPRALLLSFFAATFCSAAPTATASAGNPQSTACGDIVNDPNSINGFNASLAYECLTSVPFNPAVATRFVQYYNDTLQFQSTLAYLKDPPTSYQQPAIDLIGGLEELQLGINNGIFANEYEFEAALAALFIAAHDTHLILEAGILAVFSFGSPYDMVSVSVDGIQSPKVYIAVDVENSNGFTSFTPSPVKTINGVDAITYLEDFAAKNSFGGLESHTDYNQLFYNAAEGVQGNANVFTGGALFYPGDTITWIFENGTSLTQPYLAVYYSQGPTGPLETGGDFYNSFVLGLYPDSFDPDLIDNNTVNITEATEGSAIASIIGYTTAGSATSASASAATSAAATDDNDDTCAGWDLPFYPCADIAQDDLGGDGVVTGYFLNSTYTGVLSIPNFGASNTSVETFDTAVANFIAASKAIGLTKIVIDLQSNEGGEPLLAIDTFKRFFPNIDPYAGSRLRATQATDVMGSTLTSLFQNITSTSDQYAELVDSEWVATTRLNANTNDTFRSWAEFFGPLEYHNDFFTTVQRYDLNNDDFVRASVDAPDGNFTVFGYGAERAASTNTPPFAAENIIILSDGICASACSLFMEMMHHQANVRVVAAGGRPTTGPMQAPAGTRGALVYNTFDLDDTISNTQTILQQANSPEQNFLPNRTEALSVYVTFASVNLRDQVRINETTPLQFAYEAANCRIFYTPQTIFNYTLLWQYAADAIWSNPSLCVANSTGFASTPDMPSNFVTGPNGTASSPGVLTMGDITSNLGLANTTALSFDPNTALLDSLVISSPADPPTSCETDAQCAESSDAACQDNVNCQQRRCVSTQICGALPGAPPTKQCLSSCKFPNNLCGSNGAICTAGLPLFINSPTQFVTDLNTGVCPWTACGVRGQIKKRVGASQSTTLKRSTSGGARRP